MDNSKNVIAFKSEIYRSYIEHTRDSRLKTLLRELVDNVEACRLGGGSRRRAFFLIGLLAVASPSLCVTISA